MRLLTPYIIGAPDQQAATSTPFVVPSQTALARALREPNLLVPGKKPVGPVALNVPGAKVAMLFQRDFFDLATAQVNETYASPTGSWTASSGGFAWDVADSEDNSFTVNNAASTVTGDFLVSVKFKSNHSSGDGNGHIFQISGLSGDYFDIRRVNFSSNITVNLGHNFTLLSYTATGLSDGLWHHVVAGRISNNLIVFVDGIEVYNTVHSVAVQDFNVAAQIGATSTTATPGSPFNGEIASFLLLDHRGASYAAAERLARDPYLWLKPANDAPYLFSIPGAASNAPVLSNPTASVTGQTTATLGCTVTFS